MTEVRCTLKRLAAVVSGATISGDPETIVTGITCDSRQVSPGVLMVCIRGTSSDGHAFAARAVEAGAAALVVEHPVRGLESVPAITTTDARVALALMADRLYGHPSGRLAVVGVTGTDGKTSITNLAASIAEEAGWRPGIIGTLGIGQAGDFTPTGNTTPGADLFQAALRELAEDGARAAMVEVTSQGIDMHRTTGTEYRVVILSNLSRDHLDWHGTVERYREAKAKLFRRSEWGVDPEADTGRPSLAVLPADDPACDWFVARTDLPHVRVGFDSAADVRISSPTLQPHRSQARLEGKRTSIEIDLQLPGRFNLLNAAAAAVACDFLGIAPDVIARGLSGVSSIAGRMDRVDLGQPFTVLVDYAHTPEALRAVLQAVREFTRGDVICIVGCGGDRDAGKRPLMAKAAAAASDLVVITSDNPRSEDPEAILDDMEAGLTGTTTRWHRIVDRAEAIHTALSAAGPGDAVLIAGKGHERYQEIKGERRPFDDRAISARSLRALGHDRSKGTDS